MSLTSHEYVNVRPNDIGLHLWEKIIDHYQQLKIDKKIHFSYQSRFGKKVEVSARLEDHGKTVRIDKTILNGAVVPTQKFFLLSLPVELTNQRC